MIADVGIQIEVDDGERSRKIAAHHRIELARKEIQLPDEIETLRDAGIDAHRAVRGRRQANPWPRLALIAVRMERILLGLVLRERDSDSGALATAANPRLIIGLPRASLRRPRRLPRT